MYFLSLRNLLKSIFKCPQLFYLRTRADDKINTMRICMKMKTNERNKKKIVKIKYLDFTIFDNSSMTPTLFQI